MNTFLAEKGKPVLQLEDPAWVCDLAFLVDIMDHLNQLNLHRQGNGHLISTLVSHVKAFEMKPRLWITQMERSDVTHFITLKTVARKCAV